MVTTGPIFLESPERCFFQCCVLFVLEEFLFQSVIVSQDGGGGGGGEEESEISDHCSLPVKIEPDTLIILSQRHGTFLQHSLHLML